jgi:hypothetical protein
MRGRGISRLIGLYVAWFVAAGMLVFAAVERHPYSFYTLLRWICCPIFAYSAFAAYEKKRVLWVGVFGVLAGLYNPVFRVHLDRDTWLGVNWFTVSVIAAAAFVFWLDKKKSAPESVEAMGDRAFKLCPFCKEQIRREAIKCRFCGEWLEPSESDSARTLTADKSALPPSTPPHEGAEADSMKAVGHALDRMDQQGSTSPPKQSKPPPVIPTRTKIPWPLIIGGLLMYAGIHRNTNEPPSNNPMDLPVRLGITAAGLWMCVNFWIPKKNWSRWISLTFALLLALGVIYLGYRAQSNFERNKRFGDVLRGFTDEAEKSMKNGTVPKFNSTRDKALDPESRLLTDMGQAMVSVMGRMNEELESVGEKPVFDPSVLSSKTTLKEEINKRIESYHIVQKWQPQLLSEVSDAMKKKVDSYNDPDKKKIIGGMEQAMIDQRPMVETMCNLLEKKETAEQAFLSFMASSDYQFRDGKVFFRDRTATQSEQYNAFGQRVEDSYKEIEAFRKQRLDEMKKRADKFGH